MPDYRKDYPVSWDELHRDARALAWRLMNQEWKGVIAITRGGLIPETTGQAQHGWQSVTPNSVHFPVQTDWVGGEPDGST